MGELRTINADQIDKPYVLLRPVRKTSVEYLELKDSIETHGFNQSILVRPRENGRYEVVDGFWRFSVALEIGLKQVPCIVEDHTDDEVLAAQIRMNEVRKQTNRLELARHLRRMQKSDPNLRISDLAMRCSKTEQWIHRQLNLLRIDKKYQPLVETGEITASNAYILAKLPRKFQGKVISQAASMSNLEFEKFAIGYIQQAMTDARDKKLYDVFVKDFEPVPYLRAYQEVITEYRKLIVAPVRIVTENVTCPIEAWRLALEWALNMDPDGIEAQRARATKRLKTLNKEEERIDNLD